MAGTPSIYAPARLVGPTPMGSLLTIWGSSNAGTQIDLIDVTNISPTPIGVSLFIGASGYTGNTSNAWVYNFSVPGDGLPYTLNSKPLVLNGVDNLQGLASMVSVSIMLTGVNLQ